MRRLGGGVEYLPEPVVVVEEEVEGGGMEDLFDGEVEDLFDIGEGEVDEGIEDLSNARLRLGGGGGSGFCFL